MRIHYPALPSLPFAGNAIQQAICRNFKPIYLHWQIGPASFLLAPHQVRLGGKALGLINCTFVSASHLGMAPQPLRSHLGDCFKLQLLTAQKQLFRGVKAIVRKLYGAGNGIYSIFPKTPLRIKDVAIIRTERCGRRNRNLPAGLWNRVCHLHCLVWRKLITLGPLFHSRWVH